MNVLVVDDNRMNQMVAAGLLKRLGSDVAIVDSGEAAVAACAEHRFDMVLMDIMMPGMDGFEATARIRQNESAEGRHTCIVGLSARDMDGDRGIALAAGLDGYLTKPLRADDLTRALDLATTAVGSAAARDTE